jgi:hypothetical protein
MRQRSPSFTVALKLVQIWLSDLAAAGLAERLATNPDIIKMLFRFIVAPWVKPTKVFVPA